MLRIPIILLSLLIFTSYGCKKKVGLFAPEFVCKVDGERFKPKKNGDFKLDPLRISFKDTSLFIDGINGTKSVGFYIIDKKGLVEKKYLLNENRNPTTYSTNHGSYSDFTDTYITDSIYTGKVEIVNIDYENKRISGRFEFTAKHKKNKDETVEITDGKFNIGFE